jgi:hypothetical protein
LSFRVPRSGRGVWVFLLVPESRFLVALLLGTT